MLMKFSIRAFYIKRYIYNYDTLKSIYTRGYDRASYKLRSVWCPYFRGKKYTGNQHNSSCCMQLLADFKGWEAAPHKVLLIYYSYESLNTLINYIYICDII